MDLLDKYLISLTVDKWLSRGQGPVGQMAALQEPAEGAPYRWMLSRQVVFCANWKGLPFLQAQPALGYQHGL